jgi:hypothetical protein
MRSEFVVGDGIHAKLAEGALTKLLYTKYPHPVTPPPPIPTSKQATGHLKDIGAKITSNVVAVHLFL